MIKLRHWHMDDAGELAQMLNNKNVVANLRDGIPFPYTVKDATDFLVNVAPAQQAIHFCVDVNRHVAGSISIFPKNDVYRKTAEIGYYVAEPYWKRGIGTRAIGLATEYAWKHLDVVKLYAEVFEFNSASMRALEKNNYHLECIRKKHVIKNGQFWDDYLWVKFKPGF
ncbi:MAG: GNAT family protein [Chitinophagaceae bacterium]